MEYWKMKTLLMVAFSIIAGLNRVNSRLTVTPSDVEVVNGTWVTLNCSTDSTKSIVWIKEKGGGFNNKTVFNGSSITAEFNASYYISKPQLGSFHLEFVATEETASVYRCEEEDGDSAVAKLDIIETPGQPIALELKFNYPNTKHPEAPSLENFERSLEIYRQNQKSNRYKTYVERKVSPEADRLLTIIILSVCIPVVILKICICVWKCCYSSDMQ